MKAKWNSFKLDWNYGNKTESLGQKLTPFLQINWSIRW